MEIGNWKWNLEIGKWKLKTKTTYDSIRDICNFKNIPFEKVKEGDLDNFFDIVLKCKTRKYVRMYHRIQKNKEELEEQIIQQIEVLVDELGGTMSHLERCNSMGRRSKVLEIEYNIEEPTL